MLLVVATGCASRPSATERDFGNSVRSMINEQTLNPMDAMLPDPEPVDHGNGERLNNAMEAYKSDVSTPPDLKQLNL
jgi:hypothetical protein